MKAKVIMMEDIQVMDGNDHNIAYISRARVPGGWLVVTRHDVTLMFMPDPNGLWLADQNEPATDKPA